MNQQAKKILIADDDAMVRTTVSKILEMFGYEVETAADGYEVVEIIDDSFDVVILDINMPQMDGIEMVKLIREKNKDVKIVALSMLDDSVSIKKMLKAGANAYVLKEGDTRDLLNAIERVNNGENFYAHAVTETIMTSLMDSRKAYKQAELTKRELEVLELIFKEKNNQEVAEELFISVRTVETHKNNIMDKTGSKNMAGLVKFAIREKLFDDLFY